MAKKRPPPAPAQPPQPLNLTPLDALCAAGISLGALVVYVLTMYPDITGGDSGELITATASGGVLHPPGYPLYALLGGLFAHLPIRNLAWRFNCFSGFCDAMAAGLLFLAILKWTHRRAAGFLAAALFACSPGVWKYAITAEVFALNNLFVALLLLIAAIYAERCTPRVAFVAAAVAGLGLCNQQTLLFVIAPLAIWSLAVGPREIRSARSVTLIGVCFAAGLLPYLDLPIRAAHHAVVSWGRADTWPGFWTHVLRSEYGTLSLAAPASASGASSGDTLVAWARDLSEEIGPWGVALGILGIILCLRRWSGRGLAIGMLAAALLALSSVVLLGNLPVDDPTMREIVARFWQEPDLILCAFAAAGLVKVMDFFTPRLLTAFACLALTCVQVIPRWSTMDRHTSTLVRSFGSEILRAAPEHALIVTRGDLFTNPVRYLQFSESTRSDIRVVDADLLSTPWYADQLKRDHPEIILPGDRYSREPGGFTMKSFLDANSEHPLLVCGGVNPNDHSTDDTYKFWPHGSCDQAHAVSEPDYVDAWLPVSQAALPHIDFTGQPHPTGSWEDAVWRDYWKSRELRAALLMKSAGENPDATQYVASAITILTDIIRDDPEPLPEIYLGLAVAYRRLGFVNDDQKHFAAAAWREYLKLKPEDPKRSDIEQEIARLEQ